MRVFLGLLIIVANCGVLTTGALAQEKAAVRKTETIQENLAGKEESDVTAPHADLSYYLNESGSKQKIATRDEWEKRRQEIRRSVELVMGVLPDRKDLPPLEVEVLEEYRSEKWIRRKVRYCSDASSKITAYLFLPLHSPLATSSQTSKESEAATTARHPAILALHQTTGIGKSEPAGLGGNPNLQYALHLAERGFVTLAPDYPSFGEYEYDFQNGAYSSGSMKGIYDNMRSVDFLQSLPEVDSQRIGCIGHSLGGHNAIFTSFFDERISAVVSNYHANRAKCGVHEFKIGPNVEELYG